MTVTCSQAEGGAHLQRGKQPLLQHHLPFLLCANDQPTKLTPRSIVVALSYLRSLTVRAKDKRPTRGSNSQPWAALSEELPGLSSWESPGSAAGSDTAAQTGHASDIGQRFRDAKAGVAAAELRTTNLDAEAVDRRQRFDKFTRQALVITK